jgi:L-aminopeptidase/D-esterase-like protein
MITDVAGVRVGHWTDPVGRTGCTVVLLPEGTVASGEVRGGAPGTREFALLAPERTVGRVDAVVLSGGSAFGLAACDGVVRWCEERGLGFPTAAGPVPIVVGAVLYDLLVGDASARPRARRRLRGLRGRHGWACADRPGGRGHRRHGGQVARSRARPPRRRRHRRPARR